MYLGNGEIRAMNNTLKSSIKSKLHEGVKLTVSEYLVGYPDRDKDDLVAVLLTGMSLMTDYFADYRNLRNTSLLREAIKELGEDLGYVVTKVK